MKGFCSKISLSESDRGHQPTLASLWKAADCRLHKRFFAKRLSLRKMRLPLLGEVCHVSVFVNHKSERSITENARLPKAFVSCKLSGKKTTHVQVLGKCLYLGPKHLRSNSPWPSRLLLLGCLSQPAKIGALSTPL